MRELTYSDICFIIRKQNYIREQVRKQKEIIVMLEQLLEEIEFLEDEIESCRYSIRKKLGRA